MTASLIRKLENFTRLSTADKLALGEAVVATRNLDPGESACHEGDPVRALHLVEDGWACDYRQLENGGRQIVAFRLPGDLCGTSASVLAAADCTRVALTRLTVHELSPARIEEIAAARPRLRRALRWDEQVGASILREWLVSLGRRDGLERLAHLLCELYHRQRAVGLAEGGACPMPVTQEILAAALGQTSVHINRTLQTLRACGLVTLRNRRLTVPDLAAVEVVAGFSPAYLHLGRAGAHLDALPSEI
ncbi:Crp/Fnr family transcriptional regulator [Methylobacterium sp. NEAU 140]|uniref:Crp/Fnr family transcriptional regulator n=1 Tax=Methylobacterium sp. NEAU 140 TaxID=3064945 RepID=UPI002734F7CB|nr:Crp/Fnr family transcriptional regulator [Methylobacterium sp. NEAU 140]MDP4023542.1 Crp/Fnr family transcriptional regulator [Methylobacterium sp. NEAU 140]